MVSLRSFFRPVKDGAPPRPAILVRVKSKPAAPVSAEAYVSPLQQEVRTLVDARARECTHHCTGCKYSTGNACALDTRLAAAVKQLEDPLPFLAGMNERLTATEVELQRTQRALEEAKKSNKPSSRVRLGVYYQAGAITLLAIWEMVKLAIFGIP